MPRMSNWTLTATSRYVVAFAMTLGMLLSPIGIPTSHILDKLAAVEIIFHTELAAHIETHGHTHNDDEVDEQSPGHSHEHNPFDHTHETASTLPALLASVPPVERNWLFRETGIPDLGTPFRLERPPKLICCA